MRAARAFTLIELLVAIAVIAILAALVLSALRMVPPPSKRNCEKWNVLGRTA